MLIQLVETIAEDHSESLTMNCYEFLNNHVYKSRSFIGYMKTLMLRDALDPESHQRELIMGYDDLLRDLEHIFCQFRDENILRIIQRLA